MGLKALVLFNKKHNNINMGQNIKTLVKKIIAVNLALVLLFNISREAFAALTLPQNEIISEEIKSVLEEVYLGQGNNNYKECINKNSDIACQNYLSEIRNQFTQSAQSNTKTIEGKKSYKTYEQEYKAAVEEEYTRASEEIEKEIRQALWFSDLSWETTNHLNYLEKKSKEELNAWKESKEKEVKTSYKEYEKEYAAWQNKEARAQEEAGKKYLKAEGKKIISAYKATNNKAAKRAARELLVVLLNSESKPGEIIEDRAEVEQILLEALENEPCAYTKGSKTLSKQGADKYIGYDKPGVYPTLTREDWNIIEASYKDAEACQNAFISLEGLSYLEGTKEAISKVEKFIESNEEGLAAGDSLINGSAVLLRWKAYQNIKRYIKKRFVKENNNGGKGIGGFGGISENIAYNGNYLGEVSIYTQREDGSNAWEELAELLAEEGSAQSKEILKSSVSSCKVVKEVLGKDKLECQTIMPFLYGAVLHAPKVIDSAKPYQEAIPQNKTYLDEYGKTRQVDEEAIKRRNAYTEQTFREKLKEYGTSLSSGLAGFIYAIKFNDMPVDSKMVLDNKLAKVYSNVKGYTKGSARYNKLKTGRAVVAIFKYVGITFDVWCFVSLAGAGVKGIKGIKALTKAKQILKGTQGLSIAQRAQILRQVAYIKEGAKLRRFGRNIVKGIENSANIGRKINAGAYLAEKNGMNPINYMLHNIAYSRGKNIVLRSNILRVEGRTDYFNSSHYIANLHNDIFRVARDVKRASKIGVSELGEGGQVVSYIDKAKLKIFKNYTEDYIKGQEVINATGKAEGASLMTGQTTLLPREYLYSRKYKKILPFVQENQFARTFNIGDKIYEGLRKEGLFVINKKTGEVYNDFVFNFDGYLNKNNLLIGRELGIRRPKPQVVNPFSQNTFGNSTINPVAFSKGSLALQTAQGLKIIPQTLDILKTGKINIPMISANIAAGIISGKNVSDIVMGEFLGQTGLSGIFSKIKSFIFNNKLPSNETNIQNPLIVFQGGNTDFEKPAHINYKDIFVYYLDNFNAYKQYVKEIIQDNIIYDDLKNFDNYKSYIASEIQKLSARFKEYTIYIQIHGGNDGSLAVDESETTSLNELLDIIEQNKGDSVVNLISASCHSGSALENTNFFRKGINVLLISGRNDLCTKYDSKFIRVNDLRSTYIEAVKNYYYGATLFYEGKKFTPLADKAAELTDYTSLNRELNILKEIYFSPKFIGEDVFALVQKISKYKLLSFPDFSMFTIGSNLPKSQFYNDIFRENKEGGWRYTVKLFDDKHNLVSIKNAYFDEQGKETYNLLVNSAISNVEKAFPEYKYQAMSDINMEDKGISSFLNANKVNNQFLGTENIQDTFKAKYLKLIPTKNISSDKIGSINILNDMLERLNDFVAGKELTAKKLNFYDKLSKEIYALANRIDKITMDELEEIFEKIDILSAQKPLFVFYGIGFDRIITPTSFDKENFFVFDLSKSTDYKKDFAEKIKLFSSIFDEYTIFTQIHGSRDGYLSLGVNQKDLVSNIVDLIDRNRESSVVNWISGSCHSGADLNTNMARKGINILLISGTNDVCYHTDIKFARVNDLLSSFYDVVAARRYGSNLIYNGKIFNSIRDSKWKALVEGDSEVFDKLQALDNVFFDDSQDVGISIFNLLKNFPDWKLPSFPFQKIEDITNIPYIFNPNSKKHIFKTFIAPPYLITDFWSYNIRIYDDYGKELSTKQYPITEHDDKTHNLLLDATKKFLETNFPQWKYEPLPAVDFKSESITTNEFILDPISVTKNAKIGFAYEDKLESDFQTALKFAKEHSKKLESTPEAIERFFVNNKESIKDAIEIIGVKGLVYSYQGKLAELMNITSRASFVKKNFTPETYELLLQKLNPEKSQKYIDLTRQMNELRAKAKTDPAFREERDKITSLQRRTAKGEGLLIQDILDKFKTISGIAKTDLVAAQNLVPYILPKTAENEVLWMQKYQSQVIRQINIPYFDGLIAKANLDKINITEFLNLRPDTKKNLNNIFTLLKDNQDKDVADIMASLPWNKKTKQIFEKIGINWSAWSKANPNNFVQDTIIIDIIKEKEKFVQDVNYHISLLLNQSETLQLKAKEKDIILQDKKLFLEGEEIVSFAQASRASSIINKLIASSSDLFKNQEVINTNISYITENLPHIAEVLSTIAKEKQTIKVRLADTNDIGGMLALGKKSACCRALGSNHEEAGISLITNKMTTAFEILADDNLIGSVMVYLAQVDGHLALVLGTLETRAIYAKNPVIAKVVVNFARKFASDIGKPHIPIYTAVDGQEETIKQFISDEDSIADNSAKFYSELWNRKTYQVKPIGKIGKHPIYLSYNLLARKKINNFTTTDFLYHLVYPLEVKEKVPTESKFVSFLNAYLTYLKPAPIPLGIVPPQVAAALARAQKPALELLDLNKIRLKKDVLVNYQTTAINGNIKRLQALDISKFSHKKMRVYREVEEQLASINKKLKDGKHIKFLGDKLEKLKKDTTLLQMDTPILILRGDNYTASLPGHIDSKNFYTSDLTQADDYKLQIAQDIRDFAKVFDDFMVYIAMHGTSGGNVHIKSSKYSTILEIANIIKANKGTSNVELVSGSCHSGSGFSEELIKTGINTLLLSGVNDTCFQSDLKLVKFKDLPSAYLQAVEEGRYGAMLIYDGKIYTPLSQALKKAKGNIELSEELETLNDIYFRKDITGVSLGNDIYKLLSVFENYESKDFVKEISLTWPKIPFIFNPVLESGKYINSYLSREDNLVWHYIIKPIKGLFDDKPIDIAFKEPKAATLNFIIDAATEELLPLTKGQKGVGEEQDLNILKPQNKPLEIEAGLDNFEESAEVLSQALKDMSYQNAVEAVKEKMIQAGIVAKDKARSLALLCFSGTDERFNPDIFEAIKEMQKFEIGEYAINEIIHNLSPNNHFEVELYKKALELYEYNHNMITNSNYIKTCIEQGVFNPKIYEKFKEAMGLHLPFSERNFIESCFVDGVFNEDLYNKGLSLAREFTSNTPKILKICRTENGTFDEELFNNFVALSKQAQANFPSVSDALLNYLIMSDSVKFAFEVLGLENTIKAMNLNHPRYTRIFESIGDNIYKANIPVLKEQLALVPFEKKLDILTKLAGVLSKRTAYLTLEEEKTLLSKIADTQSFNDTITYLAFKRFDFEYSPVLAKIFDFAKSNYLPLLFLGNYKFNIGFNSLYREVKEIIENFQKQDLDINIHKIFDEMPDNQTFARICKERGVDYQAWRSFDPNFFIKREVSINNEDPYKKAELLVRKVDMDNIMKALTSGNESKACRSVGKGNCMEAAPELVRNKMVQQIELVYQDKVVGNMLLYLAEVDGQLAIVTGSFIKRPPYTSDGINALAVDFVKEIRKQIGRPDIPIYISSYMEKKRFLDLPIETHKVMLLGAGYQNVFNSFAHDLELPNEHKISEVKLYKADSGQITGTPKPVSLKSFLNDFNIYPFNNKKDFFGLPVFKIQVRNLVKDYSYGTAFYIKYRNLPLLLTAKHVVDGSKSDYVEIFNDEGFSAKAEILAVSPKSDLAVLTFPKGILDYIIPYNLALKEPEVGDKVVSIGYPGAWKVRKDKLTILDTEKEDENEIFYSHDNGRIVNGSSGSPLSNAFDIKKLFGVVVKSYGYNEPALSVPLPQIRTFLGEVVKKILFTPELNQKFIPLYPAFAKNYENVLNKFIYPSENAEKPLNLKTDIVKATVVEGKVTVFELRDAQNNIRAYYKLTRTKEKDRTELFDKIITEGNFQSKYPLINIEYPKILSTDISDLPDGIIPEDITCYLESPHIKSVIMTLVDTSGWFLDGNNNAIIALNGKPITNEEWAQIVSLFKDLNEADFYHNDLERNLFLKRDNNGKLTITIIDFEDFYGNKDMWALNEIGLELESIGAKEKTLIK